MTQTDSFLLSRERRGRDGGPVFVGGWLCVDGVGVGEGAVTHTHTPSNLRAKIFCSLCFYVILGTQIFSFARQN